MDIINQIYHALYKGKDDTQTSVAASRAAIKAVPDGEQLPARLSFQVGEMFSGEVTDVQNQDVTIRLPNGEQLSASLRGSVSVNIGDELSFLVKEAGVNQLLLQVMPDQEQQQFSAIAERALTANGFSLSQKNGQIAMALMNAGEPLDKANIMRLLQQSYKLPDADLSTLVALNKAQIPVNENNVAQYESYQNGTYQMAETITGIADAVVQQITKEFSGQHFSEGMSLYNAVLDIIGSKADIQQTSDPLVRQMIEQIEQYRMQEPEDRSDPVVIQQTVISDDTTDGGFIPNVALSLSPEQQNDIYNSLVNEGFSREQTVSLIQNAVSDSHLLLDLSKLAVNMSESGMQALLGSDACQKLMREGLLHAWTMNPDKIRSGDNIDTFYERLNQDLVKLSMEFGDREHSGHEFDRQGAHAQEQIRFIQDLNQNYLYTQLPMRLSDQTINSELYVYADKKKLMQQKDEASVLFHLDMDHLGPTDVYITMSKHQVHAVFTLEDRHSIQIVAEHMEDLSTQLHKLGLTLHSEVKKKPETRKSPVVSEIVDPDAEKSVKRYNFDVRT